MLISVSPLPHDMSADGTDAILRWAKRIFEENDGRNLEYIYHLEPTYNVDTIYALTDFVTAVPGFGEPITQSKIRRYTNKNGLTSCNPEQ